MKKLLFVVLFLFILGCSSKLNLEYAVEASCQTEETISQSELYSAEYIEEQDGYIILCNDYHITQGEFTSCNFVADDQEPGQMSMYWDLCGDGYDNCTTEQCLQMFIDYKEEFISFS